MNDNLNLVDNAQKAWEQKRRSVTLTNEQWYRLSFYILATTNYRKGEKEAWEKLALEKNEDGTPLFENAAPNVEYYEKLEKSLTEIIETIEDRKRV